MLSHISLTPLAIYVHPSVLLFHINLLLDAAKTFVSYVTCVPAYQFPVIPFVYHLPHAERYILNPSTAKHWMPTLEDVLYTVVCVSDWLDRGVSFTILCRLNCVSLLVYRSLVLSIPVCVYDCIYEYVWFIQ